MNTPSSHSDGSSGVGKRKIKAHRKSRGGCTMCKTRKVKCSETRPRCTNCVKLGDDCVYDRPRESQQIARLRSPQLNATGFDLRDLRYFHSYLTVAYPSFPLDTERAWTLEVPVIAQQFDFLNAAILSLGAAHLQANTDLDLQQTVQKYRFAAIRGINSVDDINLKDLQDPSASERATAVLASCYALTFISLYMGDPVSNFLVLVRGCASLSARMLQAGLKSPLFPEDENLIIKDDPNSALVRRQFFNGTSLCPTAAVEARCSLDAIEQLCNIELFQQEVLERMKGIVAVTSGPLEAANSYLTLWSIFTQMAPSDFDEFTNSSNLVSVVLQVHFLAFESMMRPLLKIPTGGFSERADNKLLRNTISMNPIDSTGTEAEKALLNQLVSWPRKFLESES